MIMKKNFFTCIALVALSASSALYANVTLGEVESVSLNGVYDSSLGGDEPTTNVMAYSGNDLYVSGNFNKAFNGFVPLTTGDAYIIKYNQNLEEQWKVQLQGAVSVTAMLADGEGGMYIAGTLADVVEFGSTDNNTQSIAGYEDETWGEYTTYKAASFVSHYNSEGVLLAIKSILPKIDQKLNDYATENGLWAMILDGDTYCSITKLIEMDGSILAVANLKGSVETADGTQTAVSGSYANADAGLAAPSAAGIVMELDDELNVESFPVVVASRFCGDGNVADESVTSFTAAAGDNKLYVAFNSVGTINVNAYNATEQVANEMPGDEGGSNYGYTVVAASADGEMQLKNYETVYVSVLTQATGIDELEAVGNRLVVTGLFQNALGFDKNITATSGSDMYVASINAETLNTEWAVATGYNEGDTNDYQEFIAGSAISGNAAYVYGYNEDKNSDSKTASLFYAVDLNGNNISDMKPADYILGMAENGSTRIATAHAASPVTDVTFTTYDATTAAVRNIAADKSQQVSVYPNPVADALNFSLPCDVEVYSLDGKQVLDVAGATSVDVSGLNSGVYVVKTVTAGETSFCKVLKK